MIALTFPGQGSQTPGMGRRWLPHPSWELVEEASDLAGRDVAHLLLEAEADELTATRNSQLATFVLSLVVLDAVERLGVTPARLAGHSLGEYSALVASGAISLEDGVRLVGERGDAMQAAADASTGTMSAVLGLDDDQVEEACRATGGDVWVANFNAPGQVVVAGAPPAVEAAGVLARELGAKRVMALPVGGAFHTPYMAPARDRLEDALRDVDLRRPDSPVLANVDARPHTESDEWAELLAAQLTSPVRWQATLRRLADDGVTTFVELGPGKVLTSLAKRTLKSCEAATVSQPDHLDGLLHLLAQPSHATPADGGEGLYIHERLVVSPSAGVFRPDAGLRPGRSIRPGELVGHVNGTEVRSPFPGSVMGLLAAEGDRLAASQPVAWLRTDP